MAAMELDEETIFNTARKIDAAPLREEYLQQVCGGDEALRGRVMALLQAHEEAHSFLRAPAAEMIGTVDTPPITERPGSVIGPYELMEQIGEGGFGLVFVAEQRVPVRRKVALKIIKPGMDSGEVIARFEAERQALALMDHPNIARIFDGGTTESGRPYFVMELVRGIPIIEYCDQQQLTANQRLDLFLVVCQAVQHAHGKGIIHRDLKPSNILVAPHDGVPVVKVIDFGVAKAIGQQLTTKKIYTRFTQMIGTPLYMSPEQAEINALDVDIRSDVYSLGVLLYELLTGTTPFDKQRFATAAYDEIRRIIKEEEPPKPSTRLSTMGETLPKVSAQRKMEPAKLSALVRGDLDWIVMKALEKERTRRYETASAMAEDVRRFLNDELVQARPPSTWYRVRKMARRNKALVTTAALVAAALFLGTVVSAWQAVRARRAEDAALEAQAEAVVARDEEARQRKVAVANAEKAREEGSMAKEARDAERLLAGELAVALKKAEQAGQSEKQHAGELAVALKQTEQAKLKAEANETKAEWRLYARNVASAQTTLETGNVNLFYHYLKECRADFRGWEHDYLYTLANHNQQTLRGQGLVRRVAFSPDGKRLAGAADDKTVKIWDAASGQEVLTLRGHTAFVQCVVFSPDGKRLASAGHGGGADGSINPDEVKLWDAASGEEILTLKGHTKWVNSVAFSPDGKLLAGAGGGFSGRPLNLSKSSPGLGEVKLWDTATGRVVRTLNGHTEMVNSVAFSPDGRRLASASWDRTVKLWELASGQEYLSLKGHESTVNSVVFSPDGKLLASSNNKAVKLWDAANGHEILTLKGQTGVNSIAFNPDGKRLASGSDDTTIKVWDVASGQEMQTLKGHTGRISCVAYSPDGKRLASTASDKRVKLWDLASGVEVLRLKGQGDLRKVVFSPDGKRLASVSSDAMVKLWDAASSQELLTLEGHTKPVTSVAFSPDGKRLASASNDKTVKLWDAATGQEVMTIKAQPQTGVVWSMAFSPDGKGLAIASLPSSPGKNNWAVKLWDLASGQVIRTFEGHNDRVNCVAFSPDGKHLASASWDKTVKLWDAASGQEVMTLVGHKERVVSVVFSPDGKRLASASWDNTVKLWDAASGEVMTLVGHTGRVLGVVFSPDGKRLASVSQDSTVKLWDVASGQEVLTLKASGQEVTLKQLLSAGHIGLAFSPDGRRLSTVALDGTFIIWDASKSMKELEGK